MTGAGAGLGRAIALELAAAGDHLALLDLDLDAALDTLKATGAPGVALGVDVADESAVNDAVVRLTADLGPVQVVVNNAGIPGVGPPKPVHETSLAEWEAVLGVNLRGPFLVSRATLPGMLDAGGGVFVNVASVAGMIAVPGRCAYVAAKAGLSQFTRNLAVEYAERGVRANALCPGWIETPLTEWRLSRPELRQEVLGMIPMGRTAAAAELARAAAFLASDAASYMTGQTLVVDGGWTSL